MNKSLSKLLSIATFLCQVVFGGLFVFSGFVKCIDPMGTAIKLSEYFGVLGLDYLNNWANFFAIVLAMTEFMIGTCILLGGFLRIALPIACLFLAIFTPLTLYLAVANPISDCGCFGDAVKLTNWETFWKNIALCAMLALLICNRTRIKSVLKAFIFTIYFYYALLFAAGCCWFGLYRLPILDFRPFKSGINLSQALGYASSDDSTTEYTCIYEKDGVRKEFGLDALPDADSGWTFVEQKAHTLGTPSEQEETTFVDFFLTDDADNLITEEVLSNPDYTFLLITPKLDDSSEHDLDKIESIYEYALENDYGFYCVTEKNTAAEQQWKERTGAEYPFIYSDFKVLETIIRANPGLILLKDGQLYWKENINNVNVESLTSAKLNEQSYGQVTEYDANRRLFVLLTLLFAPLAIILLIQIGIIRIIKSKEK